MKARLVVERRVPSSAEKARRVAARKLAAETLAALIDTFNDREATTDFRIEVERSMIRLLSKIVEAEGDPARALGILSVALADVNPAHKPSPSARSKALDDLFGSGD